MQNMEKSSYHSSSHNVTPLQPYQFLNQQPPVRQGKGFRVDLGLTNGPFLPQDIASTNQKSKTLLAAKQILQSHVSMSSLLENLQAKENMIIKSLPSSLPPGYTIQNFHAKFSFLFNELKVMGESSRRLMNEEKKLERQMQKSYEKFQSLNNQIIETCVPLFGSLLKAIRTAHEEEKNMFEREKREIESLQKFRSTFLDKIVEFEQRIIHLQGTLGIKTLNENQEENLDSIEEGYDKFEC